MADTLIGIFLESASRRGSGAMFRRHAAGGWETIAADRALADVESLGLGLASLGVARGDRVALIAESRYEWAITDLATLGLGAVLVPLYPTLTVEQCGAILANCGPRVLVVSGGKQLVKAREIVRARPSIETIVVMDDEPLESPRERSLADLIRAGSESRRADPLEFRSLVNEARPGDVATIIYTSGTTGEPKGVMLTHANIVSNVDASLKVFKLGPEDTALSFLPLCHIFERMGGLYAMLRAGATIAYAQSIDTVAADAVAVRPTIITGVPRFYEKVHGRVMRNAAALSGLQRKLFHWGLEQGRRRALAHFEGRELHDFSIGLADRLVLRKVRDRMGGRLRVCVSGGAALAPETMEFFFAIGIPVLEGYGLTETSPVICLSPLGHERPGSVGKPIPGVEVRIGDQGEILTRGPHVMAGYYGNDEATRQVLTDGWFHTGDVGHFDADGYLFITDRLKDLLVLAGGKKVAPQPIEAKLKQSPLVTEPVLIGDRRPYVVCLIAPDMPALLAMANERQWHYHGRAELVTLPEVRALFDAEIQKVNATLAPFETIKRFAVLGDELTQENGALTPTLKVKRRVVAERYTDVIEALYAGQPVVAGGAR